MFDKANKIIMKFFMGNNDDSSPATQQQGNRKSQEVTIDNGQNIKHQVAKMDNAHVGEDSRTSFNPDTIANNTDLSSRKGSVGVHQEIHKPYGRTRKKQLSTITCSQCDTLAKEKAVLKAQLEAGRHDLAEANKQSGELKRSIQTLVGEKGELLASANIERERVHREETEAKKQIRDLQAKNQKIEQEFNILKGTLRGVEENHSHTVNLLEERTAELKGAQTFLTTVDLYAGAEIREMVEALNDEIFHGATIVSGLLEDRNAFEVDERRRDAQLTRDHRDYLTQLIGPKLAEHLSAKSNQIQMDPFPLQLAVQAFLTKWCVFMVDSFYPGPASSDLKEIYRRIWESEPQAVAGRWRAMMTKQAKHLDSTTEKSIEQVINTLLDLLYHSGIPMSNVASQQTDLRLHQVASTILDKWMKLRTAIHEGVTTTDMEVFDTRADDIYHDEVMNDIYADEEDAQQPDLGMGAGHILCTVGMGLKKSVIRRNGDGIKSIERDIMLKAKVVFPYVLFDSE